MYIYESHMGGYYATDEPLTFDALYCDECGEHDDLIGVYDTNNKDDAKAFAKRLLNDEYYSIAGIQEEIDRLFNCCIDVSTLAHVDIDEEVQG